MDATYITIILTLELWYMYHTIDHYKELACAIYKEIFIHSRGISITLYASKEAPLK